MVKLSAFIVCPSRPAPDVQRNVSLKEGMGFFLNVVYVVFADQKVCCLVSNHQLNYCHRHILRILRFLLVRAKCDLQWIWNGQKLSITFNSIMESMHCSRVVPILLLICDLNCIRYEFNWNSFISQQHQIK